MTQKFSETYQNDTWCVYQIYTATNRGNATKGYSEMLNQTETRGQVLAAVMVHQEENVSVPVQYRTTSTGRPTLVGTRHCADCGRAEFHTKKFDKSQDPEDLNQRYTLCKGVCVYCYAQKRNKKSGTSLTVQQLESKIKYYTELLTTKQTAEEREMYPGEFEQN